MSNLHTLKPAPGSRRARRRVGRGDGSNRGSYSGRGSKGQKQHGKVPHLFEGGQLRIVKRLPHMRGFTNRFRTEYSPVNVGALEEAFDDGAAVGPREIYDRRLVRRRGALIKLLGSGDITVKIDVTVHACSDSARRKIEAAGGTVMVLGPDAKPDVSYRLKSDADSVAATEDADAEAVDDTEVTEDAADDAEAMATSEVAEASDDDTAEPSDDESEPDDSDGDAGEDDSGAEMSADATETETEDDDSESEADAPEADSEASDDGDADDAPESTDEDDSGAADDDDTSDGADESSDGDTDADDASKASDGA